MCFDVGKASFIGTRIEQQDSLLLLTEKERLLTAICDGMGGMEAGRRASMETVELLRQLYTKKPPDVSIPDFYLQSVDILDENVFGIKKRLQCDTGVGTTIVSVAIENDKLYWLSVGDSRLYIIREHEMICVTTDHNYYLLLNQALASGEITQEEYNREKIRGEHLISYIGVRGIEHMDLNRHPFYLRPGDILLLMSDGLYRCVTEKQMYESAQSFSSAQAVADQLILLSKSNSLKNQDNTTIIVIKMTGDREI